MRCAPGRYIGAFQVPSGVQLLSTAGPDSTFLDGDGRFGPVVSFREVDGTTLLSGFTIQGGRLAGDQAAGAGIRCEAHASPRIHHNVIRANRADGGQGGGVACLEGSNPVISANMISDNVAALGGGVFAGRGSGWASAPILSQNVIRDNEALEAGGGVYLTGDSEAWLDGNVVSANVSRALGGGGLAVVRANPLVEHNVFWANGDSAGVAAAVWVDDYGGPTLRQNIFARNEGGPALACAGDFLERQAVSCNAFWANPGGSFGAGCRVIPGNLTVDPGFCEPSGGHFGLRPSSPLIDAPQCGRIGAFGVGCGEAPPDTAGAQPNKPR